MGGRIAAARIPAGAAILNRPREYDQALESFSKPLMERVEYNEIRSKMRDIIELPDRIAGLFLNLVR